MTEEEADVLSDRLALMNPGTSFAVICMQDGDYIVVEEGPTGRVFTRYVSWTYKN